MNDFENLFIEQMEKLFGITVSSKQYLNDEIELYVKDENNVDYLFLTGDMKDITFSTYNSEGNLHSFPNVYNEYLPAENFDNYQSWYYNGVFISRNEYPTKEEVKKAIEVSNLVDEELKKRENILSIQNRPNIGS
jgi:hypothetical protein